MRSRRHVGTTQLSNAPDSLAFCGFSPVLGWFHYRALMNVEHETARKFYEIEAERSVWPVDHLEWQIHTQLSDVARPRR